MVSCFGHTLVPSVMSLSVCRLSVRLTIGFLSYFLQQVSPLWMEKATKPDLRENNIWAQKGAKRIFLAVFMLDVHYFAGYYD